VAAYNPVPRSNGVVSVPPRELRLEVDLENPEFVIGIEIINGKAYGSLEKIGGVGGLPVGTQGKVVVLLSGGIDSPVAAFLMLKRTGTERYLPTFFELYN